MSRFWSPLVERLSPYTPGEQADARRFLKLNTNESPFAPSPEVLRAICEAANADLRLYPEPGSDRLRSAISRTYGVPAESIFVGNGADEVLAHAFCAFFKQDAPILLPDVTYAFYETYCSLYDIRYRTIALDEDFRIDLESYSAPNGGIIFANPNSPTSRAVSRQAVEGLLETNRELLDRAATGASAPSPAGSIVIPPVAIDPTAIIEHSIVGPHVSIAARAVVRHAVVRDSIVNEDAVVEQILLEGSVIGENALVRGNFRHLNVGDSSEVRMG